MRLHAIGSRVYAKQMGRLRDTLRLSGGPLSAAFDAAVPAAERAAAGLWRRDPATWSADASVQTKIANRLGWLSAPTLMTTSAGRLRAFADSVKRDGFTDVVLLGMGGSSLAPEVMRDVLGVAPGWPRFQMLDSTDPAAVLAAETPPAHTLYLLSSKSGTTIEPNSLAAHFRRRLEEAGVKRWADHFVAITDEGTELMRRARSDGFRDLFINPSDIGGRYSAISFFGLVPAALMGQDVSALVNWAVSMLDESAGSGPVTLNPSVALGLAIAAAALAGRDKLTLVVPPSLESLGLWVEQLIAESTGKNGGGVVPVAGEPLAAPAEYGADRIFVHVQPRSSGSDRQPLRMTGAPVVEIDLLEPAALGAEFMRWEIATAVAGALLQINPFDEPNVQQAKDATTTLLDQYTASGRLPAGEPDQTLDGGVTLTLSGSARTLQRGLGADALLTLLRPGDYFSLLAYLGPSRDLAEELRALRCAVRDRTRAATMFGYGPRYLHSTGQLHKGGPNTGVFVLISATPAHDVAIPNQVFSFGTLELAQALGDFSSLDAAGRRAMHVHLPAPDGSLIREVSRVLLDRRP